MGRRREDEEQARAIAALLPRLAREISRGAGADPLATLPLGQLRVCALLMDGRRTVSEISHELGTTVSAVTQTANALLRKGLVTRTPGQADRRRRWLRLTAEAEEMMLARRGARAAKVARALARLPAWRASVLASHIAALLAACREVDDEARAGKEAGEAVGTWREEP